MWTTGQQVGVWYCSFRHKLLFLLLETCCRQRVIHVWMLPLKHSFYDLRVRGTPDCLKSQTARYDGACNSWKSYIFIAVANGFLKGRKLLQRKRAQLAQVCEGIKLQTTTWTSHILFESTTSIHTCWLKPHLIAHAQNVCTQHNRERIALLPNSSYPRTGRFANQLKTSISWLRLVYVSAYRKQKYDL